MLKEMTVYSILRKKKIESLISSLGLENEDALIIDSGDFTYNFESVVFISDRIDTDAEGIRYGENVRALGEGLYSDSYEPSVVFQYPDEDTAALAYALSRHYGIKLNELGCVKLENDSFYIAHNARDIRNIISSRRSYFRTIVIFSFDTCSDIRSLASAFQNADIVFLLSKGTEHEKAFKKAAERMIFSPVIKRLSAVIDIKGIDDIIEYISPTDVVFEIELKEQ